MSEKIMTQEEWASLSAESRAAINRYGMEHESLQSQVVMDSPQEDTMSDDRCPHCQTPYGGDLDENGKPFCDCDGSCIADLQAEIERLREALEKIRGVAGNRANSEADKAVIIGIVNDALKE